jgi:dTDP-4-dehydrorhamnose reductase
MRVFITGIKGQLGRGLEVALAGHMLAGADLPELDITDRTRIAEALADFRPDVVIHSAAWTDVDGCAQRPDEAYRVNALGTQNVALGCAACGAALAYISTNEVFDGAATEPYREWDAPHPINPYGRSKAAGEWYVRHLLQRFYIVRTAWLYAAGGRNFPHRIIALADEVLVGQRPALRVVEDEVSNPTYMPDLASALAMLVATGAYGVYHLTNSGHCSRYEFACEILRLSGRAHVPVTPITRAEFARPSTPPPYAPLANTAAAALGIRLRPWQAALAEFLGVPGAADGV